MLSAETEVRNGIAAYKISKPRNGEVRRHDQIQAIIIVTCVR